MNNHKIKQIFIDYFQEHEFIESKHVSMRQFVPEIDPIISSFSLEDWNKIFPGVDEPILEEWIECDDRVILSCIDKETQLLFGVLTLIESEKSKDGVFFHGGTWKHERRYSLLAYEGLHYVLEFLLHNEFEIFVTCNKKNIRADLLQKHFGFVEFDCNDTLSFKILDMEKFKNNKILSRIEHCFVP